MAESQLECPHQEEPWERGQLGPSHLGGWPRRELVGPQGSMPLNRGEPLQPVTCLTWLSLADPH